MIKHTQLKIWQRFYKIAPRNIKKLRFWRNLGNPYTHELLWYCDICDMQIEGTKYVDGNLDMCKICYKNTRQT